MAPLLLDDSAVLHFIITAVTNTDGFHKRYTYITDYIHSNANPIIAIKCRFVHQLFLPPTRSYSGIVSQNTHDAKYDTFHNFLAWDLLNQRQKCRYATAYFLAPVTNRIQLMQVGQARLIVCIRLQGFR